MRYTEAAVIAAVIALAAAGCSSPATEEQLDGACRNQLALRGDMRGTSEEEEVARIEGEYAAKERGLREEMARDLKGLDDVLAQAIKDIEGAEMVPTEEDEGRTADELKEELKKNKAASIEEKKKPIVEQFERLIEVLGPQKEVQVRKAREYAAKNREKADKARSVCVEAAKEDGVSVEVAGCRAGAKSLEEYDACR